MDCVIESCVRDAFEDDKEDFCKKHQLAADNVEANFTQWKVAYGKKFTRKQYLERLSTDFEIGAGDFAIEVAEYLLKQE